VKIFVLVAVVLVSSGCNGAGDDGDGVGDDGDGGDDGDDSGGADAGANGEPADLSGITAAHNQVRADHGVAPLAWDPALAAIAADWAEGCRDEEEPLGLIDHNPGRSDGYGSYVGENVYGASAQVVGTAAVEAWAGEESDYDHGSNTCSGICGHYTQVVWADTTQLGCAAHACPGLSFGYTIVCDYAPGGNDGGRPY
jgi:pathogenesis-related protein 1